ncbi:MAG: Do family serine endopeptidase [Synergistaceae bacterium]
MDKKKIKLTIKKVIMASIGALLIFAGGSFGAYMAVKQNLSSNSNDSNNKNVAEINMTSTARAAYGNDIYTGNPIVKIVKNSSPAVVNIDTETMVKQRTMSHPFFNDPFFNEFFGEEFFGNNAPQQKERMVPRRGKGSGFIVSENGYILTNNHVVEGANKVKVTLLDGRTYEAKKIGQDPTFDLAVIQIKAKDLPHLNLGDSDKTEVGEWVVAIGNPLGFENSVTAGVVSAKNRTLQAPDINFQGFMQTDAAINPGNSGGPLIDLNGNVIGINTAIVPYAQGIGFAVPINMAKQIMNDLIQHGEVRRGWLGVTVQPLTNSLVEAYKLPVKEGSIIANVQRGSAAEKYGLQRGDIIIEIGDKKIKNSQDVVFAVRNKLAGEKVKFIIYRDSKKMELYVVLDEIEGSKTTKQKTTQDKPIAKAEEKSTKMGLTVEANSPDLARKYRIKENKGLVVVNVDRGSRGNQLGFKQGDVILEINKVKMDNISAWNKVMNAKNKALGFLVSRNDQTLFISIEM